MKLIVDGVARGSWTVSAKRWAYYSADFSALPEGQHTIALRYFRDRERSPSCDRRLRIDRVALVSRQDLDSPSDYVDKPTCSGSLQSLVDVAAPGTTLEVPGGCVYREKVVINKPLALEAGSGAEIRGSEVWTAWQKYGDYWMMGEVPSFSTGQDVRCKSGTSRCLWPAQVFFDGRPLTQVASRPTEGEFAVDASHKVVLADDPEGHTVEVTTRQQWMTGGADDVTIRGFTMRHAANGREFGAITNRHDGGVHYHRNWTLENNRLYDAHTAVVVLKGTGGRLLGNEISRGGQLGVHGSGENILIRANRIHHNNTEGFDPFWEAGGVKMAYRVSNLTVDDNEVYANAGPGIWCDIDCTNVVFSNNRVHHNARSGLHFEISSGASIFGNTVWENGWGAPSRPYSPGISVEGSKNVEVHHNVVAWNASGISVIHMPRDEPRWNVVENIDVHDNTFLAKDGASLSWIQDENWRGGMMDDPLANNQGHNNDYWYPSAERSSDRFRWTTSLFGRLAAFNDTWGEENGQYMSDAEKARVVSLEGIPPASESR